MDCLRVNQRLKILVWLILPYAFLAFGSGLLHTCSDHNSAAAFARQGHSVVRDGWAGQPERHGACAACLWVKGSTAEHHPAEILVSTDAVEPFAAVAPDCVSNYDIRLLPSRAPPLS